MATSAASDSTDGPVLSLINKRLRGLRKKHNRIVQMEESVAQGKSLNKEQEEVLRSKPSVVASIEELEKLRPQLCVALQEELNNAVQRHQVSPPSDESAPSREESELKDLLNVLYFSALFDVKSQSDFTATMLTRTHERGCCLTYDYVTDDATDLLGENDLDAISGLGNLLISRPVDTNLSHKNALERCLENAKLWLTHSDQAIEPNSGITYAELRQKLNKIMVSDYFTATPEMKAPVDVAAAGNYSPFQVQVDSSSLQVTQMPVEEEGSSDAPYEEKSEEEGENQEQNAPIQASPVEEFSKHEAEEEDTSEAPLPQAEEADQEADEEFNQQRDRDMKEQQFQSRRPYQNYRGGRGRGGGGGRRGYYGGRGGRGGGGRGGESGGYQNGRHQYYDQPGNYYPRGYYNNHCTTVCKWTYLGHAHMQHVHENESRDMEACGWDDEFWEEIGLGDLVDGHHAKIGRSVAFPGHPLGSGLTPTAAKELGLEAGTPVGTSLIDAHAGGIGVVESVPRSDAEAKDDKEAICHRLVLVCGTSTCHMVVSQNKLFIPGVWGPFWSAMVPEYWLTEGGQSATGALLDYVVESHVASSLLANRAASQKISLFGLLNKMLERMTQDQNSPFLAALTQDMHVLPDFHGNRSPLADPKAKGVICGLSLDSSEKQLALLYLATVQGLAYGTRHIVEHCNAHGHKIDTVLACGGLAKNSLFLQEHADVIGCPIILPRESESVLLGAAILGAVAAKKYPSLSEAMKALSAPGQVIHPSKDPKVKKYHDAKYRIFRELYEQQLCQRSAMAEALA